MEDRQYWLGFSLIPEIGPKTILQLKREFGTLAAAWHADETQLRQAPLGNAALSQLLEKRQTLDLGYQLQRVGRVDAFLLTLDDDDYPALLRNIDDAPAVLYVRGTLSPSDNRAICIVGMRKATAYGRDAAYLLAKELATQGITIISGLAQGIDTAAHRGALDAGGRTLAVLGNGINRVYPDESLDLAREVIQQGAVITEFPLGTPPYRHNFPRRNRIMSGLALGVLVVEAAEKSGSLITAQYAGEQGRDVFAVPSNIFNIQGRGVNRLIQDGAKLVMSAADILAELDIAYQFIETRTETEAVAPADDTESQLLGHLTADPLHIDELARITALPIQTVTSTLTLLELKGLARSVGNMQYTLAQ